MSAPSLLLLTKKWESGDTWATLSSLLISLCPQRSVKKIKNLSHFQTIQCYPPWKPKKQSEASLRS